MTPAEREACGRLAEEMSRRLTLWCPPAEKALILAALREAAAPRTCGLAEALAAAQPPEENTR